MTKARLLELVQHVWLLVFQVETAALASCSLIPHYEMQWNFKLVNVLHMGSLALNTTQISVLFALFAGMAGQNIKVSTRAYG